MKVARSIKRLPEWLRSFVRGNALRVMALGALVAVAVPASGARAEPPPLAGSPEAWLEGAERILRTNTGRLLVLVSGNGATTVYAVIHAPLAAVWIFGAPPPATEVLALGKISGRLAGAGAFITITWDDGSLNTLVVAGSDGCHALRRGATIRRKGRNIYRNAVLRADRLDGGRAAALDDKHTRGSRGID